MITQVIPMQPLPNRRETMLPPQPKLGTGLIEEHHTCWIDAGEESSELPPGVLVSFYGPLPDFFREYLRRLTQRLMVGPDKATPCSCSNSSARSG